MKKQRLFFFYFLGVYVVLQFIWWGYHIIQLTRSSGFSDAAIEKRIGMIVGEGMVFFLILIFGIWRMVRSIKKEHELAFRQHNFLLSVTHELKTPLASNKLYLQTLLKHQFEVEKREELLQKAIHENERLEELVDAILISARIENRTFQIHKETIDLRQLLSSLQEKYRQRLGFGWIEIQQEEEIELNNDRFAVKTILLNLIENALKYAGKEKPLLIVAKRENNQVVIQIKDQGPGIALEQQELIFEKFFRIENEETRSKKGTGLGLFIVKEFIRLCGGKIAYRQNTPQGAIFEITL